MKRTDKMVYILENINANPIDRRIMVDGNGKEFIKVNGQYVELQWFYDSNYLVHTYEWEGR